jgi:hypothetical protein
MTAMAGSGEHQHRKPVPRVVAAWIQGVPGVEVAHSVLGFDKVWFTRHAVQRMSQRKVTQAEVLGVLARPTRRGLRTQPGRERWRRNRVDVVFERWEDRVAIITVIVL